MKNLKAKAELLYAIAKLGWLGAAVKLRKPVSVLQAQAQKIQDNPGATLKKIAARHNMLTADGRINLVFPEVDAGDNSTSLDLLKRR